MEVPQKQAAAQHSPAARPRCHCVIKLGGSAITVKDRHETLKPEVLRSVCNTIKQLHQELARQLDKPGIVLVHGAGSFGHFEASQYRITQPDTPQALLLEGFARTRASVTRLNTLVVAALVDAGLPAVGLSPCGTWFAAHRALAQDGAGIDAVAALLSQGLVPVLHGDGILDLPVAAGGLAGQPGQLVPSILSGDVIVRRLAQELRPSWAVFLTDVPGLLSRPPGEPGAALLPEVRVAAAPDGSISWTACVAPGSGSSNGSSSRRDGGLGAGTDDSSGPQQQQQQQAEAAAAPPVLSTAEHDTTGGIAGKVMEAAAVALAGCPVVIAQAGTPSGAAAVLRGPEAFSSNSGGSSGGGGDGAPGTSLLQGTLVRLAGSA